LIRCPECKIEYSYGRILFHACNDTIIFNGAIFNDDRKNYAWNCNGSEEKLYSPRELPEFLDFKRKESNIHDWNCINRNRFISVQIEEKNNAIQLFYE
jgi:hypothetical protein